MKLGKFAGLSSQPVRLISNDNTPVDKKDWNIGEEVSLIDESGILFLQQNNQMLPVEPAEPTATLYLKTTRTQVLWALMSIKKGQFLIRCVDVTEAPRPIDFDIGVSDRITQQLYGSSEIKDEDIESACRWLTDEFLLEGGNKPRIFVSVYAGNKSGTLELRGREWVATIDERKGFWQLTKLSRTRRSGAALKLLQGDIKFEDISIARQLTNPTHRHALEEAVRSHGGYMQLWQQYSNMEWTLQLEAARKLGALRFKSSEHGDKSKEWKFTVRKSSATDFLSKWRELNQEDKDSSQKKLEVMRNLPDWLDNSQDIENTGLSANKGKPWLCELVSVKNDLVTLRIDTERDRSPCSDGFICLSMHGYRKVRERRYQAVTCIQQQNNPMPQLHYLLEGVDVPFENPQKLRKLSPAARNTFKGDPTPRQKEAIKIAFNTPDMAIIIGPPGTGKTHVITALQKELAIALNGLPIQHQILISSFQHDAVDNVIAKSSVFGLPAVKVGGKSQKQSDQSQDPITSWCLEKSEILNNKLGHVIDQKPVFAVIKELRKNMTILRVSKPDYLEKKNLIDQIRQALLQLSDRYQISLSPGLKRRWQTWIKNHFQSKNKIITKHNKKIINRVRGLRTSQLSFQDDGAEQCLRLHDWIQRENITIDKQYVEMLIRLSEKKSVSDTELKYLKDLKNSLLDQLIPDYRPRFLQQVLDEDACLLLDDIQNEIDQQIKNSHHLGHLTIIDEYLNTLRCSPNVIKRAAVEYTSVLGATCQQSASNQMEYFKNVKHQRSISFNTVIVDEAARANPLDLMVPMAMGRRRIVLVGDHRQLPHLLEPKVEEQLAEKFELEQVHKEMLKISLFQKMKESLEKIGKKPGQLERVVMLDKQFRMHSVLGNFISQQFYEGKLENGFKSDERFAHGVPDFKNKVCGWIDIPASRAKNDRVNGSLYRDKEARRVAEEARKILEKCPDLSLGVITFYRAQVDYIMNKMEYEGLTEKDPEDEKKIKMRIKTEWHMQKGNERLRVGTVDAFQGKEFDVVLLSLVRKRKGRINENDEKALTSAYGFLRLENRLNVAMSRQHRLLIVVGDSKLATAKESKTAVPALYKFYELCKGTHGQIY